MKVDKAHFLQTLRYLELINKVPIENLRLFDGEKEIEMPIEERGEWKFTGLNNKDFLFHILTRIKD